MNYEQTLRPLVPSGSRIHPYVSDNGTSCYVSLCTWAGWEVAEGRSVIYRDFSRLICPAYASPRAWHQMNFICEESTEDATSRS